MSTLKERHPASLDPDKEDMKFHSLQDAFRLKAIPVRDRKPIDLPELFRTIAAKCQSNPEIKPWLKPISDPAMRSTRDRFLLQKLDRLFRYAQIYNGQKESALWGKTEDFQDFLCLLMAENQGQMLDGDSKIEPLFIRSMVNLRSADGGAFNTILHEIMVNPSDTIPEQLKLVNHPHMDPFSLAEFMQEFFRKNYTPNARLKIFNQFINSPVYQANSSILTPKILNGMQNRISGTETFKMVEIMAAQPKKHGSAPDFFAIALKRPDTSQDYSRLLKGLSAGEATSTKIGMTIDLLETDLKYSTAEADFTDALKTSKSFAGSRRLFDYALDFDKSSKRLSKATIFSTLDLCPTAFDLTPSTARGFLNITRNPSTFPLPVRISFFKKACQLALSSVEQAQEILITADNLHREDPATEIETQSCVQKAALRFNENIEITREYRSFVAYIHDTGLRNSSLEIVLGLSNLPGEYLLAVSMALVKEHTLVSASLLSRIITYPGLSSEDLEQLSRMLAQNSQAFRALTDSDKKLLDLLDAQPMTSKETKDQNNRTRNGGWRHIEVTPIE